MSKIFRGSKRGDRQRKQRKITQIGNEAWETEEPNRQISRTVRKGEVKRIENNAYRRRSNTQPIRQHRRKMLIIPKKLNRTHRRARPPIHHNLVQNIMRTLRFMRMCVFRLLAYQFFYQVSLLRDRLFSSFSVRFGIGGVGGVGLGVGGAGVSGFGA